jgi:hypothetical protein
MSCKTLNLLQSMVLPMLARLAPLLLPSAKKLRPNMALQPTANGLLPLGLHFILAQRQQAVVRG